VGRGRGGAGRDRSGGYISLTGSIRAYDNGSTGTLAACPAVRVDQTGNYRLTSSGLDKPPTYTSSASSVSRTSSPAPRCRGRIVSGEKVFKLFIRLGRVSSGRCRDRGARGGRTRRMSSIKFSAKALIARGAVVANPTCKVRQRDGHSHFLLLALPLLFLLFQLLLGLFLNPV
jgi:hypothetical protein